MHVRTAVLAMLIAAAAGCGKATSPLSPASTQDPSITTVFITNGVFSPNPVVVAVGQHVNWKNNDTIAHTATSPGLFDTGPIAPTSAADNPVLMSATGTFTYHCTIHANESGSIVVQ